MTTVVNGPGVQPHPGSAAAVEVWTVLVDDEEAAARCQALLPPEEGERLSLLLPPHRHRHICAHAAVRILASAAFGGGPPSRALIRSAEGRLAVAEPAAPNAQFEVSLAHAGRSAAIALSRGGAVGVDIEVVSSLGEAEERRFARYSLAESEFAQWLEAAAELRTRLLTRAWTRKEAVLKALGLGLAGDVRSVVTRLEPTEEPAGDAKTTAPADASAGAVALHGLPGAAGEPANWTLYDLPDDPGLVGSVAVWSTNVTVRYHKCDILYLLEGMERPGSGFPW